VYPAPRQHLPHCLAKHVKNAQPCAHPMPLVPSVPGMMYNRSKGTKPRRHEKWGEKGALARNSSSTLAAAVPAGHIPHEGQSAPPIIKTGQRVAPHGLSRVPHRQNALIMEKKQLKSLLAQVTPQKAPEKKAPNTNVVTKPQTGTVIPSKPVFDLSDTDRPGICWGFSISI